MSTPEQQADREAVDRVYPKDLSPMFTEMAERLDKWKFKLAARGVTPMQRRRAVSWLNHAAEQEKAAHKNLLEALKKLNESRKVSLRAVETATKMLKGDEHESFSA